MLLIITFLKSSQRSISTLNFIRNIQMLFLTILAWWHTSHKVLSLWQPLQRGSMKTMMSQQFFSLHRLRCCL
jgi:hypothetical protein